jgi:hypothetical protein
MVYCPIERVRLGRMTAATIGFLSASRLLCASQAQFRGREFHLDFRRAEFGFICNALSVRHIARRPGPEWAHLSGLCWRRSAGSRRARPRHRPRQAFGTTILSDVRRRRLVHRFRSSHHIAAHPFANFGIKGALATY